MREASCVKMPHKNSELPLAVSFARRVDQPKSKSSTDVDRCTHVWNGRGATEGLRCDFSSRMDIFCLHMTESDFWDGGAADRNAQRPRLSLSLFCTWSLSREYPFKRCIHATRTPVHTSSFRRMSACVRVIIFILKSSGVDGPVP